MRGTRPTSYPVSSVLAASPSSPCSDPGFRQFDFWLGDWDVGDEQGRVGGRNTITAEEDGCVVVERYETVKGDSGFSVNWFDPRVGQWTQQWFGLGILLRMTGRLEGGQMVLEGPLLYIKEGRTTTLRGIWTPLPDGRAAPS